VKIHACFDTTTSTLTYVVFDDTTRDAIVIDPVLDYDPDTARTSTKSFDAIAVFVRENSLRVHWSLETHAHADHLSAAQLARRRFDARVAIGERIREVQTTFRERFAMPGLATDGRQFDRLLRDGETIDAGSLLVRVLATPGHTPACVSYLVGDAVFTGDALFVPDSGTGRCDFPKGSADDLYESVHEKLYALPDATRVFVGHDYQPNGRAIRYETTIGDSKRDNVMLRASTSRGEFVRTRSARDAALAAPRLLEPSIRANVGGGLEP
jgi:glyoxylase-like metal-dependent hydrolase (beta-lactamase superfamily II)